jgi:hypothetical protein
LSKGLELTSIVYLVVFSWAFCETLEILHLWFPQWHGAWSLILLHDWNAEIWRLVNEEVVLNEISVAVLTTTA